MKIDSVIKSIAVDDEIFALQYFKNIVSEMPNLDVVSLFTNPYEALEYISRNDLDVVFLDIEMPGFTGLELAKMIESISPDIQIVFITAFDQYGLEAYDRDARMLLLKPFTKEEITKTIDKLRRERQRKSVPNIITFGEFNVYYNGFTVSFTDDTTKQLLALLVDREGEELSIQDGISILRPEVEDFYIMYSYSIALAAKLIYDLNNAGLEDIIEIGDGYLRLKVDRVNCDYYEYLRRNNGLIDKTSTKYMPDYKWAIK